MIEKLGKVMIVLAHPDDPEFLCGGTVARWIDEGREVIYILATRGEKGSDDPAMTSEQLAYIRESEQRAAARVLGVKEVVFLDYPDGELMPTLQLRRDLTRLIRRYRPDIVITSDPTNRYGNEGYFNHLNHPDHRAISDAALDAVFPAARDRLTFTELWRKERLEPHKVREIYIGEAREPDAWVDITDYIEAKIAALHEHKSQIRDSEGLAQRIRERARRDGDDGETLYVEDFKRIVLE